MHIVPKRNPIYVLLVDVTYWCLPDLFHLLKAIQKYPRWRSKIFYWTIVNQVNDPIPEHEIRQAIDKHFPSIPYQDKKHPGSKRCREKRYRSLKTFNKYKGEMYEGIEYPIKKNKRKRLYSCRYERYYRNKPQRNWKKYRKTQWKE